MKDFILEEFLKQRQYFEHLLDVFTLDELTRECQALLFDLSTKFTFLQTFSGKKNLSSEIVNEIRHEVGVMAYGQDMAMFRITFDQKCRR